MRDAVAFLRNLAEDGRIGRGPTWFREMEPAFDQCANELELLRKATSARDQALEALKDKLVQIVAVCDDNATVGNTALALKFVREIALSAIKIALKRTTPTGEQK